MNWRLLVTTFVGDVVAMEFHATSDEANARATTYRDRGYETFVHEGQFNADGTFVPD